MFRKALTAALAAVMLSGSALVVADTQEKTLSVTASDALDNYRQLFESRVEEMPESLTLAVGADALAYGVDMNTFLDAEGFVCRAEGGHVVLLGKTEAGLDRAVRHFTTYGNCESYSFTYGEGYRVKSLTVMGNPISEFALVIEDTADASMKYASGEMVSFIYKATGITLPVYTAAEYAEAADAPKLAITYKIDYPSHGDEAFSVNVKEDGNVDILCGRYRGALYGTYGLLQDMGWRFLSDGTEYVYEADLVDLTPEINRKEDAAIPNRFASAYPIEFRNFYGARLNMHSRYSDGGEVSNLGGYGLTAEACHGLCGVNWTGIAFKYGQPCYNDDYILDIIEEHFRDYIENRLANGAVVGYDLNYIDVAQFDSNDFCRCSTCMDVLVEEKSHAGSVLRMTNRMADMAAEYDPEIDVLMLAYQKTAALPEVTRPRDNVVVAHCFFAGDGKCTCSNHCISGEDCTSEVFVTNKILGGDLMDWIEVCAEGNVQVWYYPMEGDEPSSLTPAYDTGFEDMKFLIENGVSCVMLCGGNVFQIAGHARLLWDGDMTEEEYWDFIREQFLIYYGEGGEELFECTQMVIEAGDLQGCWCSFSYSDLFQKLNKAYISSNYDYMEYLLDRAMSKAETADIYSRIEIVAAKMHYMFLTVTYENNYRQGSEELRELYRERYTFTHEVFLKYHLQTWLFPATYAPDEIDFEKSPGEAWAPLRYPTEE